MKKILLFLSAMTMSFFCKAQENKKPFEDAIAISQSLKSGTKEYEDILKKYTSQPLDTWIKAAPFLQVSDLAKQIEDATKNKDAKDFNGIQSSGSTYSFIPQHQAIDALGTFIAKRFKEELNITFINKFRDKLNAQEDLRTVMPTTHRFLMEHEPYNYTSFLESLRAAFKRDLDKLPLNLKELVENHKTDLVLPKGKMTTDQYAGLMMGLEAVNSFLNKNSSAQILIDVTGISDTSGITDARFKFSVKLLNAAVLELTDKVSRDWYDDEAMKEVFVTDQQKSLIFLGLFYEKHKGLFANPLVSEKVDKLADYMEQVVRSYSIIRSYQDKIKDIRTLTGGTPTPGEILEYLDLTINAADQLLSVDDIFGESMRLPLIKNTLIVYARKSLAIVTDIHEKQYASAFVNSLALAGELLPANKPFKDEFIKYGNFAVNIVTAENSEAMVQALENAALPVGSYQIKRQSICNISLNAFAGGFLGFERVNERGGVELPDDVETTAGVAGFSAPIGVAFSVGSNGKDNTKLEGSSWSLFISALDLGAVTAFRLQNDKAETLPEMTFQNVLAPGAYIIHGFKGVPVSLGVGAQYGPQVRKISDLGGEQELLSLWSARVILAVDIPLFNLYTKNEK